MAVRTPDPAAAVAAWKAGNSFQKIARDPTPIVTGAPYTMAGVQGAIRQGLAVSFGADLVTNGDFATDTDWTKGAGWTISGGFAITDGQIGELSQSVAITAGKSYLCRVGVTGAFGGKGLLVGLGGAAQRALTENRVTFFTMVAQADDTLLSFEVNQVGDYQGSINLVALREIIPA